MEFKYNGVRCCIDAGEEDSSQGRLINHSHLRGHANVTKFVVTFKSELIPDNPSNVVFFFRTLRTINKGEELLFNYWEGGQLPTKREEWHKQCPCLRCEERRKRIRLAKVEKQGEFEILKTHHQYCRQHFPDMKVEEEYGRYVEKCHQNGVAPRSFEGYRKKIARL